MKKILPLLLLFLFAFTLNKANGQEAISLTAIPPRLEISGLPGAIIQETLKIRNETDNPIAIEVTAADFIVNNNQGTPMAVDQAVSGRWSLASWLTLSPKKLLLQPKETQAVNLLVQIPLNGLAGGHYAMVTYQPSSEGLINQQDTASAIIQKIGTLVYMNVIGDVTEAAHLKAFSVENKFANYGPISLSAEIENLGDVHVQPQGELVVSNWLKQPISVQKIEGKNIFPFASRNYDFSVPGKWRLGRYSARLEAVAGQSQIPLNGLIYFWIVPVKEISLIAGGGLILLIIIILIKIKRSRPKPPEETILQ